jgi:hypothetical protein
MGGNVRLRRVPLTLDECHLCAICSGCWQVRFKSVFTFQPPKKVVGDSSCQFLFATWALPQYNREKTSHSHRVTVSSSIGFSLLSVPNYTSNTASVATIHSFGVSRLGWFRKYTNAPQQTENNRKMSRKVSIVLRDNSHVPLNQFYAIAAVFRQTSSFYLASLSQHQDDTMPVPNTI